MCGIVATIAHQGRVSRGTLIDATDRLRHRGPDARRVWLSPDARVGLGHARLGIIDLETGDQPIASECSGLRLVANGEFYDFERIRTELEAEGHRFRTRSDSEVALHLYEDRGADAVHALRGEFAFVVWDERAGRLFAARDRFGIKPLYYAVHDGAVHLASEVKALAALGVPLAWDRETLYDTHFVSHPPDRTLFDCVRQVPPGCLLTTDGRSVRVEPYWDWDLPRADDADASPVDERAHVEQIRHVLEEAVRLRLRADVPVACYLSGGIDSCAVLGFASRLSPRPLRAYSLSFDHADYDERAFALEQARLSGAEFRSIDVRHEHLADHFEDALTHAERPFANAHAIAKFLLSRAVRDDGVKVVLTGEGSDEIFAGYPFFRRDALLYGGNGLAAEERQRLLAELEAANRVSSGNIMPRGSTELAAVRAALGYVPSNLEAWAQIGQGLLSLADDAFTAEFADRDTFLAMLSTLDVEGQMAGREFVNQSLYVWGKTMLPNYILSNLGDRMEMSHSVEGRLPFLDHHLFEAAARLPVAMKIKGTVEKYVLREAARPVIVDSVYRRQKHPFLSPPATLRTDGRLYGFLQDTLRSGHLEAPGIYDRRKVTGFLDALPRLDEAARVRADALLTWMASICLLPRRLGVAAEPAAPEMAVS